MGEMASPVCSHRRSPHTCYVTPHSQLRRYRELFLFAAASVVVVEVIAVFVFLHFRASWHYRELGECSLHHAVSIAFPFAGELAGFHTPTSADVPKERERGMGGGRWAISSLPLLL